MYVIYVNITNIETFLIFIINFHVFSVENYYNKLLSTFKIFTVLKSIFLCHINYISF